MHAERQVHRERGDDVGGRLDAVVAANDIVGHAVVAASAHAVNEQVAREGPREHRQRKRLGRELDVGGRERRDCSVGIITREIHEARAVISSDSNTASVAFCPNSLPGVIEQVPQRQLDGTIDRCQVRKGLSRGPSLVDDSVVGQSRVVVGCESWRTERDVGHEGEERL